MRRLLPLLLLCACAGSLVDHDGVPLVPADGGNAGISCDESTTCPATSVLNATAACLSNVCGYVCDPPLLKTSTGCAAASRIAAGGGHACAIAGGEVRCWGTNGKKELGVDAPASSATPVGVPLPVDATEIVASSTQTCALLTSGAVWCWGAGQPPHLIEGISGTVVALAAGEAHACASTASAVWCWGDNGSGQLGDGPPHAAPAVVNNVPGATVLAAGLKHTCAVSGTNVYCWGANDRGQCGTGGVASPSLPAIVQGAGTAVLGSGEAHVCSGTAGTLSCWGANLSHQIDGSPGDLTSPKGVLSTASAMAGGAGHTCAIQGGKLFCWGLNDDGQLGTGAFASATGPANTGLTGVDRIAAGFNLTCALFQSGDLKCWGANDKGQLGNGSNLPAKSPSPLAVTGR